MKIFFAGGGTGGHFYPLFSIAQEVRRIAEAERFISIDLTFLGDRAFDPDALRQEGIRFVPLAAGKMRRYFSLLNFTDGFKTFWGILKAFSVFLMDVPDVLFTNGGYASFPALFVARLFRIPVLLHTADVAPGVVHRWAARFARRIAISFPESIEYFPDSKTALVGNPIRKTLVGGNMNEARQVFGFGPAGVPTLLVLGGSQGSARMNDVILEALPELVREMNVIHQCGAANGEDVAQRSSVVLASSDFKDRYRSFGFLSDDDLRNASALADVVLSRAGSSAIFEAAAWKKPSILVPLEGAAQDHQRKNAYAYARTGAAIVVEEPNLTPHVLLTELHKILQDPKRAEVMRSAAGEFARPDAAVTLAREVIALALEHTR